MIEVLFNNKIIFYENDNLSLSSLKLKISERTASINDDFYFLVNGKLCCNEDILENCSVHFVPRICGGKGGFGSMLRAIGAQIEKTTNREACRDLSGRRLRDINEEKRLKTWIAQQAEREKEAQERKQKKLEKLCQAPKFEFKDETYDKERSELPEKVEDAVLKGLQLASTSSIGKKRKADNDDKIKKKKPKLWVDGDLEDELSLSDEDEDSESDNDSSSNLKTSESSSDKYEQVDNVNNGESSDYQSGKEGYEIQEEIDETKVGDVNNKERIDYPSEKVEEEESVKNI